MANGGRIDFTVGLKTDKSSINQLNKALQTVQDKLNLAPGKVTKGLKEAAETAKELQSILSSAWNEKLGQLNLDKVNVSIKQAYGSMQGLSNSLAGAGREGQQAFNGIASEILHTNLQIKESNALLNDFADTFGKTVKYGIASSVFNNIKSSLQEAFYFTKDLDLSLGNIRIVTGESADQMQRFAKSANESAKELGRSTLDYTKSALTFYQQGLSDEDVEARTRATMMAQNITGTGSQMAEYLTSVWNGFKVGSEGVVDYVDKLAAVADSSASDMSQLAIAMSKVASAANVVGVNVDQLSAQIATVIATTREAPESIGTSFKTIYARINDIKAGSDEAEVSLGKYSGAMASLGFNVFDANGKLRDTGEIIEDVGNGWDNLTKQQQIYLAQMMGGTRQYSRLISLFDNWTMYSDMLNTSLNSQGTLHEKNSRYMETVEAHMKQLNAQTERTYQILSDTKSINAITDAFRGTLNVFNDFLQGLGGGINILVNFGSQFVNLFNQQIGKAINDQIKNIQTFKANLNAAKLKQDTIDAVKMNASIRGVSLSDSGLNKQAEIAQRILNIRQSLTQQEYNSLTTQQQKIGQTQTQLDLLTKESQEYAKRLRLEDDDNTVANYTAALQIEEQKLAVMKQQEKALLSAKKYWDQDKQNSKEKVVFQSKVQSIIDSQNISQEDKIRLEELLKALKATQGQDNEKIKEILSAQNDRLQQQKKLIQDINGGLSTRKKLENIENQQRAREALLQQQLKERQRQQKISDAIRKTSAAVQGASALVGGLKSVFDETATAAERANGAFSAMSGSAAAIANLVVPGSGFLVQGILELGKGILELTGLWDNFENLFKTSAELATERADQLKKKVDQINESVKSKNADISSLDNIVDEYDKLSRKAGEYGKNLKFMTDEEQDRYHELTNKFAEYNDSVISGYDAQGNVIVKNQDALRDTIELLKQQRSAAIAATIGDVSETLQTQDTAGYDSAKNNLEQKQKQYNEAFAGQQYERNFNLSNFVIDIDELQNHLETETGSFQDFGKYVVDQISYTYQDIKEKIREISEKNAITQDDLFWVRDAISALKNASMDNASFIVNPKDLNERFDYLFNTLDEDISKLNNKTEEQKRAEEELLEAQEGVRKLQEQGIEVDTSVIEKIVKYLDGYNKEYTKLQNLKSYNQDLDNQITQFLDGWTVIPGLKVANIEKKQAGSSEDILHIVQTYIDQLYSNFSQIDNLLAEGSEQAIKDVDNAFKQSNTASQTLDLIFQSINKNFLNKAKIKEQLADPQQKSSLIDYLKQLYGLEDLQIQFDEEIGQYVIEVFDNGTTKMLQTISKNIGSITLPGIDSFVFAEGSQSQTWLKDNYSTEQIFALGEAIEKVRPKFANLEDFQQWVKTFFENLGKEDLAQGVTQNFDKVINAITKLKDQKNLGWKAERDVADILGISQEDIKDLNTRADWLEKIIEKIKILYEQGSPQRLESFTAAFGTINELNKALSEGTITQSERDSIYGEIFQKELDNLSINEDALRTYAQVKHAAFNSDKDREDVLMMYKQEQALATLKSTLESDIEIFKKYNQDGEVSATALSEAISHVQDAWREMFPDSEDLPITTILENVDGLKIALDDSVVSAEQFAAVFLDAQEQATVLLDKLFGSLQKIKETKAVFDELSTKARSGEELSPSEQSDFEEILDGLIQKYPQVTAAAETAKNTWLAGTKQYAQAIHEVQDALDHLSVEQAADKVEEAFNNITFNPQIKLVADTEQLDTWMDEFQDFCDTDRQLSIEIDNALSDDIQNLEGKMKTIYEAASMIGQNFIVAAQDMAVVQKVFPGIQQGMQLLSDGSYQLRQDMVQNAIGTAESELNIQNSTVVQKLQAQAQYYRNKAQIFRDIEAAAGKLARGQVSSADEAAQLKKVIEDKVALVKQEDAKDAAIGVIQTQGDIVKETEEAGKDIVSESNQTIKKIDENVAKGGNSLIEKLRIIANAAKGDQAALNTQLGSDLSGILSQAVDFSRSEKYKAAATGHRQMLDNLRAQRAGVTPDGSYVTPEEMQYYAKEEDKARQQAEFYQEMARTIDATIDRLNGEFQKTLNGLGNVKRGEGINGKKPEKEKQEKTPKEKEEKEKQPAKPDNMDLLKDQIDLYHDINIQLEKIDRRLGKIQDKEEKLTGKRLINNLNKQLELLDKQVATQKQKQLIAKGQAETLRAQLKDLGVSFGKDKQINNYVEILAAHQKHVNDMIAYYNSLSKEEQQYMKDTVEQVKKEYEELKDNIERYDKLVNDTIPGIADDIQSALQEKIDVNLKKFHLAVDVRVDMSKLTRDYQNFLKTVVRQIRDDDILGQNEFAYQNIKSYFKREDWSSTVAQISAINDIRAQIDSINKTGTSSRYGDDKARALEDLANIRDSLQGDLEDILNYQNQIKQSVFDSIELLEKGFSKEQEYYGNISEMFQHNTKLIQLMYGDQAYDKMNFIYQQQTKTDKQHLASLNSQKQFWYEQIQIQRAHQANLDKQSNAWKEAQDRLEKYQENWQKTTSELNSALQDAIQNIITKYQNVVKQVFSGITKQLSGGKSLEYVVEEWELIKEESSLYLDNVNSMYAIEKLRGRYEKTLKDTRGNVKAQKQLNALMENQLSYLEKKDKLTQYDIDYANKLLDLEQKRLELADTANNKTKLRLRRDTQGNYSFQYTADEDNRVDKMQQLKDAENELYNFVKQHQQDLGDSGLKAWQEYISKMEELRLNNYMDDVEKLELQKLYHEKYFGSILPAIAEQYSQGQIDLAKNTLNCIADGEDDYSYANVFGEDGKISSFYDQDSRNVKEWMDNNRTEIEGTFSKISNKQDGPYAKNLEAFKNMIQGEGDNGMVPIWKSGIGDILTEITKEDGFQKTVLDAYGKIDQATKNYKEDLAGVGTAAGVELPKVGQQLDPDIEKTQGLKDANKDLLQSYKDIFNAITGPGGWLEAVESLITKYGELMKAAEDAVKKAYETQQFENHKLANQTKDQLNGTSSKVPDPISSSYARDLNYEDSYNWQTLTLTRRFENGKSTVLHGITADYDQWGNMQYYKNGKRFIPFGGAGNYSFDTGGYTGDWSNNSGKLAILHEKELVLNKEDTENILNAVNITRALSDMLKTVDSFNVGGFLSQTVSNNNDSTSQNIYYITADFPAVANYKEIQMAFQNLANRASQYIYTNRR